MDTTVGKNNFTDLTSISDFFFFINSECTELIYILDFLMIISHNEDCKNYTNISLIAK